MHRIVLLFFLLASLTACSNYSKLLSNERAELSRVAQSKLPPQQKLDALLGSAVRVMDAALQPIDPTKGGKLVEQYYRENEASMEAIARSVGGDFKKMNLLDQGAFAVEMLQSPNAKKFVDLYPRFKKKYNQVQAVAKFTGFFGRSLGGLGKLAGLLG
ncbi:MAG: hypothetical protein SFV52_00295 [Saprospiraceae bacterium]|nr:hypothetical protein [Saprospiraceae bacterium]